MQISYWYAAAKSLHLIGAISWMAGLFYLVRIMVYYAAANEKPLEERKILQGQFGPMLWKAYRVIIQPAVVITWSFGCMMLFIQTIWLQEAWFMVKFALLLMLTAYTWYCKQHIIRLEKNFSPFSHIHYRMLNEAPTILMVGIIFLAVYKNTIHWGYWSLGIGGFVALIGYAVLRVNRKK